jgi:TetR/AcrR family transcriptional repressor of nem operon
MKAPIRGELIKYDNRMLPLMPGRQVADQERAFFAIFSTLIGAIAIARILPDQAARSKLLASARDFLLRSFL